ncbi:hypothetical protein SCARD494_13023 [Seiridium cardinale]
MSSGWSLYLAGNAPDRVNIYLTIGAAAIFGYAIVIACRFAFDPLRHIPGPLICRVSRIPFVFWILSGKLPFKIKELHDEYGEAVRVAPDEVHFLAPEAWKDIYGPGGTHEFKKDLRAYPLPPNGAHDLLTANTQDHARQRRLLAHAFSEKILREQESLIGGYVHLFVEKLSKQVTHHQNGDYGMVDLEKWFNYCTFDIVGDLTFGKPFYCLQNSDYHPWVASIFAGIKAGTFANSAKYLPLVRSAILRFAAIIRPDLIQARLDRLRYSVESVDSRVNLKTDRPDFIGYITRGSDESEDVMSREELDANADLLVLAGSETTSTMLTGCAFNMLKNRYAYEKLVAEVFTHFKSQDDITFLSVQKLPYLNAFIQESFRMYPPVPIGVPRVVPERGAQIAGFPIPQGDAELTIAFSLWQTSVTVTQFAANHSAANFTDPERFIPERWMEARGTAYEKDRLRVVQPFSSGPRNCIGQNLAWAEIRMTICKLLWNFELELAGEKAPRIGIFPSGGREHNQSCSASFTLAPEAEKHQQLEGSDGWVVVFQIPVSGSDNGSESCRGYCLIMDVSFRKSIEEWLGVCTVTVLTKRFFNDPLRSYPGPLFASLSRIPFVYWSIRGDQPFRIKDIHDKYGDVVRVAPDELSFRSPRAWKDIYGHKGGSRGHISFAKDPKVYNKPSSDVYDLLTADDETHSRQRRSLSHAFSDKALRAQEHIIQAHAIEVVRKFGEMTGVSGCLQVDMVEWLNFYSADVNTDLTFGESLNSVTTGELHPWAKVMYSHIKANIPLNMSKYFPIMRPIFSRLSMGKELVEKRQSSYEEGLRMLNKRMSNPDDRGDFTGYMLQSLNGEDKRSVSFDEVHVNGTLLVLAASETTGSLLCGLMFYILANDTVRSRLEEEIHSAFEDESQITLAAATNLPFLHAVVEETLRIYPPVPIGLPRIVPKGGSIISGKFVPEGTTVSVAQYAAYRSETHFSDPDSFLPDRWLNVDNPAYAKDERQVVQAFSYGPRNCIGKHLAYAEARLIMCHLFWNFDLTLSSRCTDWNKQKIFIHWKKSPLLVKVQRRMRTSEGI